MKKSDFVHLYINFRIWLLRLVGFQRFSIDKISAKHFDELELIWFDPRNGKKLSSVVPSDRKYSTKYNRDPIFMVLGQTLTTIEQTNTGVFRLNKCNISMKRL